MTSLSHVSLITLGVRDVAAATRFYARLGWRVSSTSNEDVTFLKGRGVTLGLYGRRALADDAHVPEEGSGFRGVALAANVPERGDVDAALAFAKDAGARIVKPAEDAFWGGRSGYFADPDGHLWEIAWNPGFPLAADGTATVPE